MTSNTLAVAVLLTATPVFCFAANTASDPEDGDKAGSAYYQMQKKCSSVPHYIRVPSPADNGRKDKDYGYEIDRIDQVCDQ